jgi:hypothetical protein
MGRELYSAEQFIQAIKGSGGIVSTIAQRVGCEWNTARSYIDKHATVAAAYAAERETLVDACESVLVRNVQIAQAAQREGKSADTSDAKWVLARLGKERGYTERNEITGKDGEPIETKGHVTHGLDGDTAATIFDILEGAGAFTAALNGPQDDKVHTA